MRTCNLRCNEGQIIEPFVSSATKKNWARLHTSLSGRLVSRANKKLSQKKIIPREYFSHKTNLPMVRDFIAAVESLGASVGDALFTAGACLLERAGIVKLPHVQKILAETDFAFIDKLSSIELPSNERDLLGLLYQSMVREGEKNAVGLYYTPQKIASDIVKEFDFCNGQILFDPCCGSGSFLLETDAQPQQLIGADNDPVAVMLAKINLLLKFPSIEFIPRIFCLDFLSSEGGRIIRELSGTGFDYIATNPPWGAAAGNGSAPKGTPKESFTRFFVKSWEMLKSGGHIRFLFPKSVLNIKAHCGLRTYMLEQCGISAITVYGDTFSGVATDFIDIECKKGSANKTVLVKSRWSNQDVNISCFYETANRSFCFLSNEDTEILRIVKNAGRYTLADSVWALGIVTGDNKNKLTDEPAPHLEAIYTGKEIMPFVLSPAKHYILYSRKELQQAARDECYRASEKLAYKFISKKLVFAYDDTGSLFLNSANVLIPNIPSMSIKTVMAFLNSDLFGFVYSKMFGDVKVLKGNLIQLPFPRLSPKQNILIESIVDEILSGKNNGLLPMLQKAIFDVYGLSRRQTNIIRAAVK